MKCDDAVLVSTRKFKPIHILSSDKTYNYPEGVQMMQLRDFQSFIVNYLRIIG